METDLGVEEEREAGRLANGTLSVEELQRRHVEAVMAKPAVTSCYFCEWSVEGTVEGGAAAYRAHREAEHPDKVARSRRDVLLEASRASKEKAKVDADRARREELETRMAARAEMSLRQERQRQDERHTVASTAAAMEATGVADGSLFAKRVRRPAGYWTHERMLGAYRRFVTENGRPPSMTDVRVHDYLPPGTATKRGVHADLVVELGFARPTRATRYDGVVAVPVEPQEPPGAAEVVQDGPGPTGEEEALSGPEDAAGGTPDPRVEQLEAAMRDVRIGAALRLILEGASQLVDVAFPQPHSGVRPDNEGGS